MFYLHHLYNLHLYLDNLIMFLLHLNDFFIMLQIMVLISMNLVNFNQHLLSLIHLYIQENHMQLHNVMVYFLNYLVNYILHHDIIIMIIFKHYHFLQPLHMVIYHIYLLIIILHLILLKI